MKNKNILVMSVVSALSLTTLTYANETSKLTLNKNNIKVWTIQDPQKPMLSYRAETILNTSLERAVGIVIDVENAKSWIPNIASAELLSQDLVTGDFKLYMVLDFPFPLKDRDVIVQGKMSKDANGLISIKNRAIQQGKAKNPNYIRLKSYEGDWFFQPLGTDKVKVITSGFADPEGSIPQSVTNLFVEQQPYQMLQKMKAELAKPNKKLPELPQILK
jgi:hypothetical protein